MAFVERFKINKSQFMDCPLGQNKVAVVVERWPLQEV